MALPEFETKLLELPDDSQLYLDTARLLATHILGWRADRPGSDDLLGDCLESCRGKDVYAAVETETQRVIGGMAIRHDPVRSRLTLLAVTPELRGEAGGHRYGRALLHVAAASTIDRGNELLTLVSRPRTFYQRYGFRRESGLYIANPRDVLAKTMPKQA